MLYPQKLSSQKGEKVLKILLSLSVALGTILIVINKLTTPHIHWAALANCGIIYIWVTVIYSIKNSANVAAHVLLQTIIMSALTLYIDERIGFRGWSISIAIPIILIIANATMFILTMVTYKNYIKYAIYQIMIVFISLISIWAIWDKIVSLKILSYIAMIISLLSLVVSLTLSFKDVKEAVIRKLHM